MMRSDPMLGSCTWLEASPVAESRSRARPWRRRSRCRCRCLIAESLRPRNRSPHHGRRCRRDRHTRAATVGSARWFLDEPRQVAVDSFLAETERPTVRLTERNVPAPGDDHGQIFGHDRSQMHQQQQLLGGTHRYPTTPSRAKSPRRVATLCSRAPRPRSGFASAPVSHGRD